jgi:predicted alpha-1,6-mannanase (GH76 family)
VLNSSIKYLLIFLFLHIIFLSNPTWLPAKTNKAYQQEADIALDNLLNKFWNEPEQYLNATYPNNGKLTGYWVFAQAFDVVLDGVERTGNKKYKQYINWFYQVQNNRGWLVGYFDDENWMALALLRAYDLTGDKNYLNQSQMLYADIMTTGWDTTCGNGGIWWDKKHTQKATASNAGPVITGVRLYQLTKNEKYLNFAKQVYTFWYSTMVNPTTYQVADHFEPDGKMVWWRFTYNEGLMIGASLELFKSTGDKSYLQQAHQIARFMIKNEIVSTAYGNVLFDGTNQQCTGDAHLFKGIAYRYLTQLYQQDITQKKYYAVLKSSADAIWNLARNKKLNVFAVNWAGPPMNEVSIGQQISATMAINIYANLLNKQ